MFHCPHRFVGRGRKGNLPCTDSEPHFTYLRQWTSPEGFRTSPKQSSGKDPWWKLWGRLPSLPRRKLDVFMQGDYSLKTYIQPPTGIFLENDFWTPPPLKNKAYLHYQFHLKLLAPSLETAYL